MSYAVRNDGQGWRAIDTQDDVGPDEHYSQVPPSIAERAPVSVTMRQARLALLSAGLLNQVNQTVALMGEAAIIEWEFAQTVDRNSAIVAAMATELNLDAAQIDALFADALSR